MFREVYCIALLKHSYFVLVCLSFVDFLHLNNFLPCRRSFFVVFRRDVAIGSGGVSLRSTGVRILALDGGGTRALASMVSAAIVFVGDDRLCYC